jgi:hypothetical protein
MHGPAQVTFIKENDQLKITGINYHINDKHFNRMGPSTIIKHHNHIHEGYWDTLKCSIWKLYYNDGSVKSISIRFFNGRCERFKIFPTGILRDNIGKEYNKMIPKIEELFKLAGKDYKVNAIM